jgi:hypothetical protein
MVIIHYLKPAVCQGFCGIYLQKLTLHFVQCLRKTDGLFRQTLQLQMKNEKHRRGAVQVVLHNRMIETGRVTPLGCCRRFLPNCAGVLPNSAGDEFLLALLLANRAFLRPPRKPAVEHQRLK